MPIAEALRFKKRYLIPLWIIRILLVVWIIAVYAYALKYASDNNTNVSTDKHLLA